MRRSNKLQVLLVHGTWSSSLKWKQGESSFQERFRQELKYSYSRIGFQAIEWTGHNRAKARGTAAKGLNQTLDELRGSDDGDTEYLLIGHSHGGNIATEAARDRMAKDKDFPLRGVVCLNTPFLKHELRASASYLIVWLLIAAFVGLGWGAASAWAPAAVAEALGLFNSAFGFDLHAGSGLFLIFVCIGLLSLTLFQSHQIQNKKTRRPDPWGPRPRVLCLSSADDEAITLMTFGEGLANLPQLLLHPFALLLALGVSTVAVFAQEGLTICTFELACWASGPFAVGMALVSWVTFSLSLGLLSSAVVTWIFGLNRRDFFRTMVTRVLVSYTPLQPALAIFRAITDYDTKWSPAQIFHSRIYQSELAVKEMCLWILGVAELREQLASERESGKVQADDDLGPRTQPMIDAA